VTKRLGHEPQAIRSGSIYSHLCDVSHKGAVSSWSRDQFGGDFSEVVDTATLLIKELKLKGILQVSNMRIPSAIK